MERTKFTSSADLQDGEKLVDSLYMQKLATAKTVDDVRSEMQEVMQVTGTDGDIGKRAQELSQGLDKSTAGGHGGIQLKEDLGSGVLGQNKLGSNDSVVRKDQFTPEAITEKSRYTLDTVLHENDKEVGHAGQDPTAVATLAVIDKNKKLHEAVTTIEGNVVSNVSEKIGQRREGLPKETYLEGADLVESIGNDKVDTYVRKGGANVGKFLQTEMWRMRPEIQFEEMKAEGAAVGMNEEQIRAAAKELGKEIPNNKNNMQHVALAA